ncbi:MAG: hypothetical protein WB543_14965 [Candidatus Acidiferrum sp.]
MIQDQKLQTDAKRREVLIDAGRATLEGTLTLPSSAKGLVLFAHGSGSSRHSPRNRYVAEILQSHHIGTLLFDLLTHQEEAVDQYSGEFRFNIPFLAKRLVDATTWIKIRAETKDLNLGYFGASTGAGAAIMAAAELPGVISSIVSRGGRPDLAGVALAIVHAPTLLIVGGHDEQVITLNRQALARLRSPDKKLVIIPGATHLFEEPGTLEDVATLAAEWFISHFTSVEEPHSAMTRAS